MKTFNVYGQDDSVDEDADPDYTISTNDEITEILAVKSDTPGMVETILDIIDGYMEDVEPGSDLWGVIYLSTGTYSYLIEATLDKHKVSSTYGEAGKVGQ